MKCCDNTESTELFYSAKASRVKVTNPAFREPEVSIERPLLLQGAKPRRGWAVTLKIKGADIEVKGASGHEVFLKSWHLLKNNGMANDLKSVWLNLNMQWLANTRSSDALTTHEELMKITLVKAPPDTKRKKKLGPKEAARVFIDTAAFLVSAETPPVELQRALSSFIPATSPEKSYTGDSNLHLRIKSVVNAIPTIPNTNWKDTNSDWYASRCGSLANVYDITLPPVR